MYYYYYYLFYFIIGIAEKLDYISDLGVTAIWLTPFAESPLRSDGYDVSDYLKIQNVFGSQDHFKYLLKEAHKKSIYIVQYKNVLFNEK